jgi:hypothetical protein
MSDILSVLVGIDITDSKLTSSTAVEPATGEVVWNAATNYAVGAVAIRTTTHRRYECLLPGVDAGLPESTPLRWADLGPTNRWAMLDGESSTQTIVTSPLTVVLHPGPFNSIYLDGLDADSISVTVKDAPGGNVIYTYTGSLEGSAPADYYEYFFEPFRPLKDLLLTGVEPYSNAEISITLTTPGGSVKCGVVRVGDLKPLGRTLSGATAKPKSYSRVTVDAEGKNVIKRGKKARDMSATALVTIQEARTVLDTVTDLLDVPCLWVCSDSTNYSGLRQYGLGSAEMNHSSASHVTLSLNVTGLI